MNRPALLLAAVAAAAIGAVALALPAAADTPVNIGAVGSVLDTVTGPVASAAGVASSATSMATSTATATMRSTTRATVASTATANPARGDALVAADVCAALTVGGLHVLGQDSGLSALLHATLNVGADSDADRVTAARRALGCSGSGRDDDRALADAKVCAALTVGKLTTVLDRLDADADLHAVVDSARNHLGDTVASARRSLCHAGSRGSGSTMTTMSTATPLPVATTEATPAPVAVPAPVGAPETGA